jgi:chromosome segregation ATPase
MATEPSALQSLFEAVQSLRAELERARLEAARGAEQSQAKDAELARLRGALAAAEQAKKAVEAAAKAREAELGQEIDESVRRERLLREKFEEELRKLGRMRAAAEAELRESLSLRDKELAALLVSQNDLTAQHRQERKRLEELVTGYESELGRLRAVLQALDDKLARSSAADDSSNRERRALETLMSSLLSQNTRLQGALEALMRGSRDQTMGDVQSILERFGGEVRQLELRLSDQMTVSQKLMEEADGLRDRLWEEGEARRTLEERRMKVEAELQLLRPRAAQLSDELRYARDRAESLETERGRLEARLAEAELKRSELEKKAAEAGTHAEAERTRMKQEYDALIADLRKTLEELAAKTSSQPKPSGGFLGRLTGK